MEKKSPIPSLKEIVLASAVGLGVGAYIAKRDNVSLPKTYDQVQERVRVANEGQGEIDMTRLYSDLRRHEGVRNQVYVDTLGNRTIGVGFNMERAGAREDITRVGGDYDALLVGQARLSENQINNLLREDTNDAISVAENFVGPREYNELAPRAREILIDMAFNMGPGTINRFRNFRQALIDEDYSVAADEMENSRWYGQVGNRSRELVRDMRSIAGNNRD